MQNHTRRYTAKEWDEQRPEIAWLWENNTMNVVMDSMKELHGFEATSKQYKDHIKKWGLQKHIQTNEMEVMIRKQEERKQEQDKETAFILRGRLVDQAKIDRYKRNHGIDVDVDIDVARSPVATPADMQYSTPVTARAALSPQAPSPGAENDSQDKPREAVQSHTSGLLQPRMLSLESTMQSGYSDSVHSLSTPIYGWAEPPSAGFNGYLNGSPLAPPPRGAPPRGAPPPSPSSMQYFGSGASQGYAFQYSNCTGRRKAVLVGINYFASKGQLRGCINDVKNMSAFLHDNFGYHRENMVILTDDQQNPMSQPTKANILRAMHWLVKDARPNDSLFFHFSGHGGQSKDLDGDEEDGYDEVIYPVDFRAVGAIVDDEIHRVMVQPLQPGVRLTAIFDSCHSGTALDLPYIYSTQGILKEPNLAKEAGQGLLGVISSYSQGDLSGVSNNLMGFFKKATNGDDAYSQSNLGKVSNNATGVLEKNTNGDDVNNETIATKTSPADVVMWSASRDDKTTTDASTGAMSWAFITALKQNPDQSYVQLLNSIRDILAAKYTQKPQLSCSHPLNTNLRFVM